MLEMRCEHGILAIKHETGIEELRFLRSKDDVEIQYVRDGRYALYICGKLYKEYPNFDAAADDYEEVCSFL